jgi:hypothetical protein
MSTGSMWTSGVRSLDGLSHIDGSMGDVSGWPHGAAWDQGKLLVALSPHL